MAHSATAAEPLASIERAPRLKDTLHSFKVSLKSTARVGCQAGAEYGMLFLGTCGSGYRFLPWRRRSDALFSDLEEQRATDAEGGQPIDISCVILWVQRESRAGSTGRAIGCSLADDTTCQMGVSFQGIHTVKDMIHLAEKSIHKKLALCFIQAELFQKNPDTFP